MRLHTFKLAYAIGCSGLTIAVTLFGFMPSAAALEPVRINDQVWAIVGDLGQRSAANLGNNATFGVILTADGVVLVDAGATAKGAAAIEVVLKRITDRPVVAVINTGGQDHRWLGNSYWKAKGARLISSRHAVADQKARFDMQLIGLRELAGESTIAGSTPVYADETFDTSLDLIIGGIRLQLRYAGRAHTPGDFLVWLPTERVMFAGDIVVVERMLAILPAPLSTSADWLKAFDVMAAFVPTIVVPGHGQPVTLQKANYDTRDYLQHLRTAVKSVIERKGSMIDAGRVDQSKFSHLVGSKEIAGRNAETVFVEMEFD